MIADCRTKDGRDFAGQCCVWGWGDELDENDEESGGEAKTRPMTELPNTAYNGAKFPGLPFWTCASFGMKARVLIHKVHARNKGSGGGGHKDFEVIIMLGRNNNLVSKQLINHIWRTRCSSGLRRTFRQFSSPLPTPPQPPGGCSRFQMYRQEGLEMVDEKIGTREQVNNEYPPRNNRTYLITRCVGRIARSRNEQIFDGSLGLFASMHDRYRLESWGYVLRR